MIRPPQFHCIVKLLTVAFACLSVIASFNVLAASWYKWIDAEGNISYQDKPPPTGQTVEKNDFSENEPAPAKATTDVIQLPVSLYISNDCRYCEDVRTILEMNQIPYQQYQTDSSPEILQELLAISGSNKVPTVVIGEQVIDMLDRRSLESALRYGGHPWPELSEE